MKRSLLICFMIVFPLAGSLFAQDTLPKTISVKKNKKFMVILDVYNYKNIISKESGLLTECSNYNEKGQMILYHNFYINTKESYRYNAKDKLTGVEVMNTYLNSYKYQDSFVYDDKDRLIEKIRFMASNMYVDMSSSISKDPNLSKVKKDTIIFLEKYVYDENNRMIEKSNKKGNEFSYFTYKYDSIGQQIQECSVDVRGKDSMIVINTTTYNERSLPIKYETKNFGGLTLRTVINKFDAKNRKTETSAYDHSFRLVQKFEFIYDEEGNMSEQYCHDYKYVPGKKDVSQSSESKIKYVRQWY